MTDNMDANIYFIDTSALVGIFRSYPGNLTDPVWERLEGLFLDNRMFSHRIVYDEITTDSKHPDLLSKRVTPLQPYFRPMSYEQAQLVSNIIKRFPGLIDPQQERDQAGPWLIAAAMLEQKQGSLFNQNKRVYVVSEESGSGPDKVPTVTRDLGLNPLNLSGLYQLINL
jgi:hypothetical protein